jgi:hypothetical protein
MEVALEESGKVHAPRNGQQRCRSHCCPGTAASRVLHGYRSQLRAGQVQGCTIRYTIALGEGGIMGHVFGQFQGRYRVEREGTQ